MSTLGVSVSAVAYMSDLMKTPSDFRPLLSPDSAILEKEPHINRETADVSRLYRLMQADEHALDWGECGWVAFKGRRELYNHVKEHGWLNSITREPAHWGALKLMALSLQKDEKTVTRYCERGLIPFASRTSGGHWRIAYSKFTREKYHQMLSVLLPQMRKKTAVRRINKERLVQVDKWVKQAWIAFSAELLSGRNERDWLFPEEVDALRKISPGEEIHVGPEWLRASDAAYLTKTLLLLAVRRLQRKKLTPTNGRVAKEIGISRATLYRRYSAEELKSALGLSCGVGDAPQKATLHEDGMDEEEPGLT